MYARRRFVNMFLGMKDTFGGRPSQQLIMNLRKTTRYRPAQDTLRFSARWVERNYSKEEIMEWNLNYAYFGEAALA
jgi:hypothetical protein